MQSTQHVFRKYHKRDFEAVVAGTRAFDVCLETDDLNLEVGDLITFQEVDQEGNLTGQEITKKVSQRFSTRTKDGSSGIPEGADKTGLAILGFVPSEMQTLKSIYDYGYTIDLVIDKEHEGPDYFIFEGPHYSPIISCPDLVQGGILEHIKIEKWPVGRYSITLMVRLEMEGEEEDAQETLPQLYIADALILVASPDMDNADQENFILEELDIIPLMDGHLINLEGKSVEALAPNQVEDIIVNELIEEPEDEEDPEKIEKMMKEFRRQESQLGVQGNEELEKMARKLGLEEPGDMSQMDRKDALETFMRSAEDDGFVEDDGFIEEDDGFIESEYEDGNDDNKEIY